MTLRKKIYFTKNGVHILKSHLKKKDKIQKINEQQCHFSLQNNIIDYIFSIKINITIDGH